MRKRWLISPTLALLGLGIGAYSWWHSPSTATEDTATQAVSSVLGSETSLKPWRTDYFSTSIPTTMRVKTSTDSAQYGTYLLTSVSARQSDQVGVTVAKLGGNSLDEVPAVKLRLGHPESYTPVTKSYAPEGAYVFTNETSYETAVIWQANSDYAAVVASGTSARRAELEQAVQAVVANWQWQ